MLAGKSLMESPASSRRRFLAQSVKGLGSAWLAANWTEILAAHQRARHATQAATPLKFEFFTPEQAAEVEAIAAQIIPTDESPGARESGVIYFIDRALATFDREKRDLYLKGLQELQQQCSKTFAPGKRLSQLEPAQQIEIFKSIEKSDFFEAVRVHTITGFFASDEYGGNKDQAGWKLIGFEDEHSFEPPFGYYDRPENMGGGSQ
jgi:gluconate 2-dehydrogenase gamma chain